MSYCICPSSWSGLYSIYSPIHVQLNSSVQIMLSAFMTSMTCTTETMNRNRTWGKLVITYNKKWIWWSRSMKLQCSQFSVQTMHPIYRNTCNILAMFPTHCSHHQGQQTSLTGRTESHELRWPNDHLMCIYTTSSVSLNPLLYNYCAGVIVFEV
jgi:hypothetical protein